MAFVERACDRGQHLDPPVYRLSTLEAEFLEEEKSRASRVMKRR